MRTYVLYHANCLDGFAAALAARQHFGDKATYLPVNYQANIDAYLKSINQLDLNPESIVYILDFSYPREVMLHLLDRHVEVITLDHHKTAQEELLGLRGALFDMNKSGAMLTWEHFNPGVPAPLLFQYVQDRDLWKWQLPDTKQVTAALRLMPLKFESWQPLLVDNHIESLRHDGATIVAYQARQIEDSLKHVYLATLPLPADEISDVAGWIVCPIKQQLNNLYGNVPIPQINCTNYDIVSELCHRMLTEYPNAPFVASYSVSETQVTYSLRSRKDFDCSSVAKVFGGGGHAQASGFKIPRDY